METLRIESLTKSFGDLTAVDSLTLFIEEGEIFGLVGPDGAGKTTTMRLLASIMEPTSGNAWVMGHHVMENAEAVKEHIGYMSQRFGLYPDLTVMENINFYADIYSVPLRERKAKVERLLSFSNLSPFKKRLTGNLSGGMKQKLGLVCALIHKPKILFLDEPTNGVDPVSRRDFWRILYQLHREKVTIIVSTSYLDEAERCSRLGLMHHGKIFACGTPAEIKTLMTDAILEIYCPNPRQALSLLREGLNTDKVNLFGDRLHLVTREPKVDKQKVKDLFAGVDLKLENIQSKEPSLEDVFVSVLSKQ